MKTSIRSLRSPGWLVPGLILLLLLGSPGDAVSQSPSTQPLNLKTHGLTDTQIQEAQVTLATSLVSEVRANMGKAGMRQLRKVKTSEDLARFLAQVGRRCGECTTVRLLSDAVSSPSRHDLASLDKAYGLALLRAGRQGTAYTSDDEGDEEPPAEDPPEEDPPGDDPPEDDPPTGEPPIGDPPDEEPCESPLECLSNWGVHIGPCDSPNGGLPPHVPDESGEGGDDEGGTIIDILGDILGF